MTARELLTNALLEIGAIAGTETPSDPDAVFALGKLNRLLNRWNATRRAVYAQQFVTFTLTPALAPHTIGPTGTFVVTQRPVSIESASLIFTTSTPNGQRPIHIRDAQWWAGLRVPDLSTSMPTDLYYEPSWPNGSLFFWPVPSAASDVVLEYRIVLAALALTDTFTMPPGYEDAVTLSLAESLLLAFPNADLAPAIVAQASQARADAFGNNSPTPRLATADYGLGLGRRRGSRVDYVTREML